MTPHSSAPLFVGIDIGAHAIQICTSAGHNENLSLADRWNEYLMQLLGPRPIVALEPTGRHYSAPVIHVLDDLGALILQVDHATTKRYRQAHVSNHKTDFIDALTLRLIAEQHFSGEPIRGVKLLNVAAEDLTTALRALIDDYLRADTSIRRIANRTKQLAHHIWPALSQRFDTYLRAVEVGAVTPQQLHDLAASFATTNRLDLPPQYHHGRARNALLQLVAEVPLRARISIPYDSLIAQQAAQLRELTAQKQYTLTNIIAVIEDPELKAVTELWRTVPGNSDFAIAALHAAIHCRAHEATGDELRGALGFYPQEYTSGSTSHKKQPIRGYKPARRALHLWTMTLLSRNSRPNPIADYFDRQKARNKPHAFQAARGKLVRVLAGIARRGEPCNW